ncbi:hypothetical protein [Mesorhizobium sp.]|uniref:hypothetical protein n=1 Tax=Mesorhizobium sp. TaxID=1871066 RepID=UPI0012248BBD|nr:hypothetical protein [Mesorhizobium sp.]TIO07555.1 MAG: hypothetical protein E5X88_17830 [Mesorhizobium sp.]TIO31921.1 MAG: hypothetical protein E5X89_21420 [Mesorhizobium sp.]TIP10229.1 MAG: hypothetical protein E5X73_23025 [Mesorhizobium sp.]
MARTSRSHSGGFNEGMFSKENTPFASPAVYEGDNVPSARFIPAEKAARSACDLTAAQAPSVAGCKTTFHSD